MFDGAVIILSLAPMVASTVANGPRSPWDAISLIILLRIWRVKRVIDGECREGWGRPAAQGGGRGLAGEPSLSLLPQGQFRNRSHAARLSHSDT